MIKLTMALCIAVLGLAGLAGAQPKFERDVFPTAGGDLGITFLGHGTLLLDFGGKTVHVDPYGDVTDYGALPKADLVLVTHEHFDHMDLEALRAVLKPDTVVVAAQPCAEALPQAVILGNGRSHVALGLTIEAVPAYNVVHKRPDGQPFHPRGSGNGYVVTFGDKRVYIAGDTENIPEMKRLGTIDIAFLPMNLPYTMTPEMVAEAARVIRPKVLYPYHFGATDTSRLVGLLRADKDIEVRIRKLS